MSWVAFLRAVNVGGRTVKMERLRTVFEELKFRDVSTFIASGNVLFASRGEAAGLERRIERRLEDVFGFEVTTFLRDHAELRAVAEGDPFPSAEDRLMVGFLREAPPTAAIARVMALQTPHDELRVVGREVWWRRRDALSDLRLAGGGLEKALGVPMTMRSITTVRKLATLTGNRVKG